MPHGWSRFPLPLLAAAATALALPAAASAYEVSYGLSYEASGSYKHVQQTGSGDTLQTAVTALNFSFFGDIADGVVARDGHFVGLSEDDKTISKVTGTHVITRADGPPVYCGTTGLDQTFGWLRFADPYDGQEVVPLVEGEPAYLRPFDDFVVTLTCDDGSHEEIGLIGRDGLPTDPDGTITPGHATFDYTFELPREVFGMGFIEQFVGPTKVTGPTCPNRIGEVTVECTLEWAGRVQLRKQSEIGTPPQQQPAPRPQPPAAPAADDDFLVPLVAKGDVKVSKDAKTAEIKVTCASGCSGEIELVPLVASGARVAGAAAAKPKKQAKPLARKRFTLAAAADPRRLKLKIPAKARKQLRGKKAKLQITFTKPAKSVKSFTVRFPKAKR